MNGHSVDSPLDNVIAGTAAITHVATHVVLQASGLPS